MFRNLTNLLLGNFAIDQRRQHLIFLCRINAWPVVAQIVRVSTAQNIKTLVFFFQFLKIVKQVIFAEKAPIDRVFAVPSIRKFIGFNDPELNIKFFAKRLSQSEVFILQAF